MYQKVASLNLSAQIQIINFLMSVHTIENLDDNNKIFRKVFFYENVFNKSIFRALFVKYLQE